MSMNSVGKAAISYRFDDVEVDPGSLRVEKDSQERKITPRAFDVLVYFIEHRGRIVEKQELFDEIWREKFVTDNALSRIIKEIRQVIGDDADAPRYIETLPKRGYRFIANIENVEESKKADARAADPLLSPAQASSKAIETNGEPTARSGEEKVVRTVSSAEYLIGEIKSHKWAVVLGFAAVSIAVAAIVYLTYFTRGGETIDSVAVLPFVNGSNDASAEYLSDGISDSIVDSLSHLPNLKRVIPFSSVLRFKGKQIDPQAVGRELDVRGVLTGRLTQRGDELLITAELVGVRDNKRLWGGQYNRKLADVHTLQGEIAREISEKILPRLTGEQKERFIKPQTRNTEAYQLYLQGLYYWRKINGQTQPGDDAIVKSREYFQSAIEKDPNYALPYAGLADFYGKMAGRGHMRPKDAWRKSEEAAVKALAIDDSLAEAHQALGAVKMWYDWDWLGAERELKRAIELNPEFPEEHDLYDRVLEMTGRIDEAIADVKARSDVAPSSSGLGRLAHLLFEAGRFDEAIEEYRRVSAKGGYIGGPILAEIYLKQAKYDEALGEVTKERSRVSNPRILADIGYIYAAAGKRDEAIKVLHQVKALTGERYNLENPIAAIYAALGDKDQAFAWLEKAYEDRDPRVADLKVDTHFDTLRSDPRFTDLLRRVRLAP